MRLPASLLATRLIRLALPAVAGVSLLLAGCGKEKPAPSPAVTPAGTATRDTRAANADSSIAAPPPSPARQYRAIVLHGASELRALPDSLGDDSLATTLALNRIDLKHTRVNDTIIVVDPPAPLDSLSPFPATLPGAESLPKLLLVSNRVQAWAAYANGARVRWGACCTGRKAKPTPPGLYHTHWRQRSRHSTIDGSWFLEWYVNLDNFEGISFHLFELPGYPASHSCVRLSLADAKWIYAWCETWTLTPDKHHVERDGTPTLVLDRYAYGQRRPWRALPQDPHACDVPADSILAAIRSAKLDAPEAAQGRAVADSASAPSAP